MSEPTTRSRREVLVTLGAGVLGGCTALESDSDPTTTAGPRETQTQTATPPSQSTPTQTASGGGGDSVDQQTPLDGIPSNRLFRSAALREDYLEAALTGVATVPSIRYLQPNTHELKQMRPKRDRFLLLSVTFANQKTTNSWVDLPPRNNLQAWAGGSTFESLESLYVINNVEVKPSLVRMPLDAPFGSGDITLDYSPSQLGGDKQRSVAFLYDVPASDDYLLEWDSSKKIEGSTDPAYLGLDPDE